MKGLGTLCRRLESLDRDFIDLARIVAVSPASPSLLGLSESALPGWSRDCAIDLLAVEKKMLAVSRELTRALDCPDRGSVQAYVGELSASRERCRENNIAFVPKTLNRLGVRI